MNLKPWYKVVTPREDLREGKPLDAAEFAVHLDKVRDGTAPDDYQKPERFFERTYLTKNLLELAGEVARRLSGEITQTSAVFNMATQFGGGKTHALTLFYHLARYGPKAHGWRGVSQILQKAGIKTLAEAATAVFVGTEFDSLTGRGGDDGAPLRKTPWGEIAFQLGGPEAFMVAAEHDKKGTAPAGDVIRKFLPKGKPALILIDELMNYVSRNKKGGLSDQLYDFLQNLSETVRGERSVVLAVSIPASELEMTSEDEADYNRFKKMLDRVGKAVIMAAETETSEIIRRRLFEWGGVPDEGKKVVSAYADWVIENRQQLPSWFPIDQARDAFAATYPFHPTVISVFERKWQQLPRFQQTRGILRLLALWVSRAYQEGFKGGHKDPLIGTGTAPLEDSFFRAAAFEQLGESRLEGAVTTDICGKADSHALRLDKEADEHIRKARLHRKAAVTVFFESNGGQTRDEATIPEIRLAVGEPEIDIGNIETVLEGLVSTCYYLSVDRNRYKFSLSPNLNKVLADRKATIQEQKIEERAKNEIQKVFAAGRGIEFVFFPERSNQIPDRPVLTLAVLSLENSLQNPKTLGLIGEMTRNCGTSSRTNKTAVIWAAPETDGVIKEEARKVLAWEEIQDEQTELRLDDSQKRQLAENLKIAFRDLKESVWRSYKNLALLGKDNKIKVVDLGLIHSSTADSLTSYMLNRLQKDGELEGDAVSPSFLIRNWPPAFHEWSTKAVRDAFFASPLFPRLTNGELIKETIAKGVSSGVLAYLGKTITGEYDPFYFKTPLAPNDVEISEEMFIAPKEIAESYMKGKEVQPSAAYSEPQKAPEISHAPESASDLLSPEPYSAYQQHHQASLKVPQMVQDSLPIDQKTIQSKPVQLTWSGEIPAQKWMNFYTKILSKFAMEKNLKLNLNINVLLENGVSAQAVEEIRQSLRELGLGDDIRI